jgi:hypothetical protein
MSAAALAIAMALAGLWRWWTSGPALLGALLAGIVGGVAVASIPFNPWIVSGVALVLASLGYAALVRPWVGRLKVAAIARARARQGLPLE